MKSIQRTVMIVCIMCVASVVAMAQPKATMDKGAKIYNEYCKTCHQANGTGLGAVYPPLAKSDYIAKTPKATLIGEIVNGKSGKVKVNGKEYNGVMTPLPAKYTDDDAAAVITYALNSWGNKGGTVTAAEVKKVRKKK
jgi:nitrite reductase (NO-forming)